MIDRDVEAMLRKRRKKLKGQKGSADAYIRRALTFFRFCNKKACYIGKGDVHKFYRTRQGQAQATLRDYYYSIKWLSELRVLQFEPPKYDE